MFQLKIIKNTEHKIHSFKLHVYNHNNIDTAFVQIAEYLLEQGAAIDVGDRYENTPLHRAASKGHVKLVKLLLQYRPDVNYKDTSGNTPLQVAIPSTISQFLFMMVVVGWWRWLLFLDTKCLVVNKISYLMYHFITYQFFKMLWVFS